MKYSETFDTKELELVQVRTAIDPSVFTITEKAPTGAFTFKTLLKHCAKQTLTAL